MPLTLSKGGKAHAVKKQAHSLQLMRLVARNLTPPRESLTPVVQLDYLPSANCFFDEVSV